MEVASVPKPDGRYRVHRSSLVYGLNAYFIGRAPHLAFMYGIQRVVFRSDSGKELVVYDTKLHELHNQDDMADLVQLALSIKRSDIRVMGTEIRRIEQVVPHAFFFIKWGDGRDIERELGHSRLMRRLGRYRRDRLKEIDAGR